MNDADKPDFKQAITALVRSYNKPAPDKFQIRAYWATLSWMDIDRFERLMERVYRERPKYLPSAPQLANLARGGTTAAPTGIPAPAQRRRTEIAALTNRLNGIDDDYGVKLMAVQVGAGHENCRGIMAVAEMCEADARHWIQKYQREAEAARHGDDHDSDPPPDRGRAAALTDALRRSGA